MKQIYLVPILMFVTFISYSQISDSQLKKYGIDSDLIESILEDSSNNNFSFDVSSKTTGLSQPKSKKFNFNPKRSQGDKWHLTEVDGKSPTSKDIERFNKTHNKTRSSSQNLIRKEDMTIDHSKSKSKYLVIKFRFNESSLKKESKFFKDFIGYIYINKSDNSVSRVELKSTKPFTKLIMKVVHMNMKVYYSKNNNYGVPLKIKSYTNMKVKMMGKEASSVVTQMYSNYKKESGGGWNDDKPKPPTGGNNNNGWNDNKPKPPTGGNNSGWNDNGQ